MFDQCYALWSHGQSYHVSDRPSSYVRGIIGPQRYRKTWNLPQPFLFVSSMFLMHVVFPQARIYQESLLRVMRTCSRDYL